MESDPYATPKSDIGTGVPAKQTRPYLRALCFGPLIMVVTNLLVTAYWQAVYAVHDHIASDSAYYTGIGWLLTCVHVLMVLWFLRPIASPRQRVLGLGLAFATWMALYWLYMIDPTLRSLQGFAGRAATAFVFDAIWRFRRARANPTPDNATSGR